MLTKTIKYSIIIFISGFIIFAIIQGLTKRDESYVIVDANYKLQLDQDILFQRYSGLILLFCSITSTVFTGFALAKKKSQFAISLFLLQLLASFFISYVIFISLTAFWI